MSIKKDQLKFFTLILEEYKEDGLLEATKVPAKKGKTIFDSVQPIFENYGISFDNHSLYLGSSSTPVPLHEDTFPLRGQTLYVRVNEKFRIMSFRRSESKKSPTNASKRFSQLLEEYETKTLEADKTDGLKEHQASDGLMIEESWKDLITEDEGMEKRKRVQQETVWELFTTELGYIRDLKVIIEVFKRCFKMLQYGGYLSEVDDSLIFANIEDIYNVNITFWGRLKNIIEGKRITKTTISPHQLVEAFEEFQVLFQPYITFCNTDLSFNNLPDLPSSTKIMLKQFVAWCDNHERCKRITLAGFLIKPLQRVTKYALLLKSILNKTDDEDEKRAIEEVMSKVETFVSKINSTVRIRQEQEKLNNIIARLYDYSPVDPINDEVEKIIREYCNLDLRACIPGLPAEENRFLIKEGPLKLVGKQGKKEIYAFLFSDMFLITKIKRNMDKYRITHQPFLLSKVVLRDMKDPDQFLFIYMNEYDVITTSFVLQENMDEGDDWRLSIGNAKGKYVLIQKELSARNESVPDDIVINVINENESFGFRKRSLSIRRNTFIQQTLQDIPETANLEKIEILYEWDNALTVAVIILFIGLNFTFSHLFGK